MGYMGGRRREESGMDAFGLEFAYMPEFAWHAISLIGTALITPILYIGQHSAPAKSCLYLVDL